MQIPGWGPVNRLGIQPGHHSPQCAVPPLPLRRSDHVSSASSNFKLGVLRPVNGTVISGWIWSWGTWCLSLMICSIRLSKQVFSHRRQHRLNWSSCCQSRSCCLRQQSSSMAWQRTTSASIRMRSSQHAGDTTRSPFTSVCCTTLETVGTSSRSFWCL